MESQDCVAIIGAIAAAQLAMVGALIAGYIKLRENAATLRQLRDRNSST